MDKKSKFDRHCLLNGLSYTWNNCQQLAKGFGIPTRKDLKDISLNPGFIVFFTQFRTLRHQNWA